MRTRGMRSLTKDDQTKEKEARGQFGGESRQPKPEEKQ